MPQGALLQQSGVVSLFAARRKFPLHFALRRILRGSLRFVHRVRGLVCWVGGGERRGYGEGGKGDGCVPDWKSMSV